MALLQGGGAARERFLGDRLPAYRALRFLERTRGSAASVYAFYAENHVYYAPGRFQGDWAGPARFAEILESFRNRYLLSYEPTGVEKAGWHKLTVRVKGGGDVRARRGYWGGS